MIWLHDLVVWSYLGAWGLGNVEKHVNIRPLQSALLVIKFPILPFFTREGHLNLPSGETRQRPIQSLYQALRNTRASLPGSHEILLDQVIYELKGNCMKFPPPLDIHWWKGAGQPQYTFPLGKKKIRDTQQRWNPTGKKRWRRHYPGGGEALIVSLERSSFIHCTPWLQAVPSEIFFLFHYSLPPLMWVLGIMASSGASQFSQWPFFW